MNCYIKLLKFVLLLILFSFNNVLSQIEKTHVVEKGETLYSLSKKFDITIQKLKELNNLDDNTLSVGQRIIYSIEEDKIENNKVSDEFSTSRVDGFASSINGMDDSSGQT